MKKNNKKGFFLSETMVVIAVVAVVLLSVFKLFNSVYFGFNQSEKYNTTNAINALANVQKYYNSVEKVDVNLIAEDKSFVDLTNYSKYSSTYYERLKKELNINSVYLIDLNKYFSNRNTNDFYITLKNYIKTLQNVNAIVLVVVLDSNEYAFVKLEENVSVELVGNKDDEYAVYVPIGGTFTDPGYINWDGVEPTVYWENGKELDTNNAGTYYLFYEFGEYIFKRKVVVGILDTVFSYTGGYQIFDVPYNGYYKVELWGASGGNLTYGGKGAYVSGIINLDRDMNLYVYVGGEGGSNATITNLGGYNGGGYSGNYSTIYSYGGGGATDIRLSSGLWNNDIGLNDRIIVAAGGAGSASSLTTKAANGGTLIGENSTTSVSNYNSSTYLSIGSHQTGAGFAYGNSARAGAFGFALQSNAAGYGGGGGGGYYAGGTGYGSTGSSGSSFISGYAGVNAITSSTDRTHTNNTIHYSNKYFVDGKMQAGINSGDGKAKITYIGNSLERNTKLNNVRYIKDCTNGNTANTANHWIELQAIYNGNNVAKEKNVTGTSNYLDENKKYTYLVDGQIDNSTTTSGYGSSSDTGLQCITIDLENTYNLDEISVWHYWDGSRSYNNHSLYVSSDNETWTTLIDNVSGVVETANGIRVSAYD